MLTESQGRLGHAPPLCHAFADEAPLAGLVRPWQLPPHTLDTAIGRGPIDLILSCRRGLYAGRFFHICRAADGEVIGSDGELSDVTAVIQHASLSPRHCSIVYKPETQKYLLRDLGSRSGTWVKVRKDKGIRLCPGHVLNLNGVFINVLSGPPLADGPQAIIEFLKCYDLEPIHHAVFRLLASWNVPQTLAAVNEHRHALLRYLSREPSLEITAEYLVMLWVALADLPEYYVPVEKKSHSLRLVDAADETRVFAEVRWGGAYLCPTVACPPGLNESQLPSAPLVYPSTVITDTTLDSTLPTTLPLNPCDSFDNPGTHENPSATPQEGPHDTDAPKNKPCYRCDSMGLGNRLTREDSNFTSFVESECQTSAESVLPLLKAPTLEQAGAKSRTTVSSESAISTKEELSLNLRENSSPTEDSCEENDLVFDESVADSYDSSITSAGESKGMIVPPSKEETTVGFLPFPSSLLADTPDGALGKEPYHVSSADDDNDCKNSTNNLLSPLASSVTEQDDIPKQLKDCTKPVHPMFLEGADPQTTEDSPLIGCTVKNETADRPRRHSLPIVNTGDSRMWSRRVSSRRRARTETVRSKCVSTGESSILNICEFHFADRNKVGAKQRTPDTAADSSVTNQISSTLRRQSSLLLDPPFSFSQDDLTSYVVVRNDSNAQLQRTSERRVQMLRPTVTDPSYRTAQFDNDAATSIESSSFSESTQPQQPMMSLSNVKLLPHQSFHYFDRILSSPTAFPACYRRVASLEDHSRLVEQPRPLHGQRFLRHSGGLYHTLTAGSLFPQAFYGAVADLPGSPLVFSPPLCKPQPLTDWKVDHQWEVNTAFSRHRIHYGSALPGSYRTLAQKDQLILRSPPSDSQICESSHFTTDYGAPYCTKRKRCNGISGDSFSGEACSTGSVLPYDTALEPPFQPHLRAEAHHCSPPKECSLRLIQPHEPPHHRQQQTFAVSAEPMKDQVAATLVPQRSGADAVRSYSSPVWTPHRLKSDSETGPAPSMEIDKLLPTTQAQSETEKAVHTLVSYIDRWLSMHATIAAADSVEHDMTSIPGAAPETDIRHALSLGRKKLVVAPDRIFYVGKPSQTSDGNLYEKSGRLSYHVLDAQACPEILPLDDTDSVLPPLGLTCQGVPLPIPSLDKSGIGSYEFVGGLSGALFLHPRLPLFGAEKQEVFRIINELVSGSTEQGSLLPKAKIWLSRAREWLATLRDENFFESLQNYLIAKKRFPTLVPGALLYSMTPAQLNTVLTGTGSDRFIQDSTDPPTLRSTFVIPKACGPNALFTIRHTDGQYMLTLSQASSPFVSSRGSPHAINAYVRLTTDESHNLTPEDTFMIGSLEFAVLRFNTGIAGQQGYRNTMEDEEVTIQDIPGVADDLYCSYFAVYDGHGGRSCAEFLHNRLHHSFRQQLFFLTGRIELAECPKRAIYGSLFRSFLLTDRHFLRSQQQQLRTAGPGCAAAVVIILGNWIWTANCGDARAVLSRNGRAIALTSDHKPIREDEAERIEKSGGFVKSRRVLGRLAVSRAFGDIEYKSVGLGKVPLVIADPEIRMEILQPSDDFLLVACDGLFDVFSSQDAVDFIHERLAAMPEGCQELIRDAIESRRSRDNVTAILVTFKRSISSAASSVEVSVSSSKAREHQQ